MDNDSYSSQTILDIRNITLSYGKKIVVSDFSLTLQKGEKIILAGPNGSGKTTVLKSILGLITPDEGTIWKTDGLKTAYSRQGAAVATAPISVREVVAMGLYKSTNKDVSKIDMAMDITGVKHLASRSFSSLSGGERQRVQIALCIAREADLVLMDEPSSFLDVSFRDELAVVLNSLPATMSAIVVTHDEILTQELGWTVLRTTKEGITCRG